MRRKLVEHLLEHPCVDCGIGDLRVLDLAHLNPSTKIDCISRLMANGVWKRVEEELEKCEVRCDGVGPISAVAAAGIVIPLKGRPATP